MGGVEYIAKKHTAVVIINTEDYSIKNRLHEQVTKNKTLHTKYAGDALRVLTDTLQFPSFLCPCSVNGLMRSGRS